MKMLRVAYTPMVGFILMTLGQMVNIGFGLQPWMGEPLLSVFWAWTATYLVGAAIATVAALDGARLLPYERDTVWNQSGVRRRFTIRLWLIGTLSSAAPALAVIAWMASNFGATSREAFISAIFSIVTGLITIGVYVGMGISLGALLGKIYGSVVTFMAVLMLQLINYRGQPPVLVTGGASDSILGLCLSREFMALQAMGLAVMMIGIAIALLLTSGHRIGRLDLSAVVLLVATVPALVIPGMGIDRFIPVPPSQTPYACLQFLESSRVRAYGEVCQYTEHLRVADDLFAAWGEISSAAHDAGIENFPTRLLERAPASGPFDIDMGQPGSTVTFTLTKAQLDPWRHGITTEWLIGSITQPTWCSGLWSETPPGPELWEANERAASSLQALVDATSVDEREKAARDFTEAWDQLSECPGVAELP